MTEEELRIYIQKVEEKSRKKIYKLKLAYAKQIQNFNIGDIIKNDFDIMRITKIGFDDFILPECLYIGVKLRKNLKPFKPLKYVEILQRHARKIEGMTYKEKI